MEFRTRIRRAAVRSLGCCALFATVCTTSAAQAGYPHATTTTIDSVVVLHDGGFYLTLHDEVCAQAGNKKVAYSYNGVAVQGSVPTDAAMDRMLRVAMAAHLSGGAVRIYTENGGSRWGCLLGAVTVL